MNNKVLIIAEAGVNHNGDIALAKRLVDAAADAGADIVKFQTFKAKNLVSKNARKAEYQSRNTGDNDDSQYAMLQKLELSVDAHYELISHCKERAIKFLSTAFDEESLDFLNTLDMPLFKVPSGEITNKPYLQHIVRSGKPIVLSTGMADLEEIGLAIAVMELAGLKRDNLVVLHCNTEYPTPMKDVNLRAMLSIQREFGVRIGYSDHTLGIEVPIAAVALGACVIEKHFTLDRNFAGPDHKASLEPFELKSMVASIRNIEQALSGNGVKEPSPSERKNIAVARKSIHLLNAIEEGDIITPAHLIMKRPGDGISPMEIDDVIGKTVLMNLDADTKLSWQQLEK